MHNFTPVEALIGGLMIGTAASMLLWLNGRVAGASGILAGSLPPTTLGEAAWRLAFIAGLIIGALIYQFGGGGDVIANYRMATDALFAADSGSMGPTAFLIGTGLLVGFGSQVGSGCTSGHAVCGIARLSPRSIVSTLVFMAAAAIGVYLVRHVF